METCIRAGQGIGQALCWRLADTVRTIFNAYRIRHTVLTHGSMVLREDATRTRGNTFLLDARQKKSPDSRRGSRCGPVPSGPLHAIAFLIRR